MIKTRKEKSERKEEGMDTGEEKGMGNGRRKG